MLIKVIKIFTIGLFFSTNISASEFELFNKLKEDLWNMGLDFEYVHSVDFKLPKNMPSQRTGTSYSSPVNSVPYDLIHRFESHFSR